MGWMRNGVVLLGWFAGGSIAAATCAHGSKHTNSVAEELLQACEAVLSRGEAGERREALAQLATLVLEQTGREARESLRLIVAALEDPALEVRLEAVRLLPLLHHGDAAVEALTAALEDYRSKQRRLLTAVERERERTDGSFVAEILGMEKTAAFADFPRFGVALLETLQGMRDDRSAKELVRFLQEPLDLQGHSILVAAANAALVLGERDCFEAVLECTEDIERAAERESKARARYQKGAEVNPSRFGRLRGLTDLRTAFAQVDGNTAAELRRLMQQSAQRLGLDPAPEALTISAWKSWWKEQRSKLPARLGRLPESSLTDS